MMRDAHIVDRKVKTNGLEKVIRIDSQFALVSDEINQYDQGQC